MVSQRTWLAVSALLLATGCGASYANHPLPASIPALAVDRDACEVIVRGKGNDVPDDAARELKREAAEGLDKMSRARGGVGAPARFRLEVSLSTGFSKSADAKLLLEVAGRKLFGEGHAEGGPFERPELVARQAVLEALDSAARSAPAAAPATPEPQPMPGGYPYGP